MDYLMIRGLIRLIVRGILGPLFSKCSLCQGNGVVEGPCPMCGKEMPGVSVQEAVEMMEAKGYSPEKIQRVRRFISGETETARLRAQQAAQAMDVDVPRTTMLKAWKRTYVFTKVGSEGEEELGRTDEQLAVTSGGADMEEFVARIPRTLPLRLGGDSAGLYELAVDVPVGDQRFESALEEWLLDHSIKLKYEKPEVDDERKGAVGKHSANNTIYALFHSSFIDADPDEAWQSMFAQLTPDLEVLWVGYYSARFWREFAETIPRTLETRWGGHDGDLFYETSYEVSTGDPGYAEALREWLWEERGFWLEVFKDAEAEALAKAYDAHRPAVAQRLWEMGQANFHPGTRPADALALAEAAEAKARTDALNAWIAAYGRERYEGQVRLAKKYPRTREGI